MLSLIKIRIKYIIRKPCLLFWTYLFLPIIITISAVVLLVEKSRESSPPTLRKFNSLSIDKTYKFFNDSRNPYSSDFITNMTYTSFLVEDKKDCNAIKETLDEFNIKEKNTPLCVEKESEFNNYTQNIIKLEKKKGKYTIDLTSRETYVFGYKLFHKLFDKSELYQDNIIDAFYVHKNSEYKPESFNKFFELESILARILLKLENKPLKHNFEMNIGFNKYPDSYDFADIDKILVISLISFTLTLQFSLVTYNINMRMVDERESKLNILLERQGISKFKYMLSWLFTFLALFLLSIIAFTLLIWGQANGHIYLFIIDLLLFTISLYSVCVLFTTCIKTVKTGATAIKFYNFGSIFLGFAIVLPKAMKSTKIIFGFIPQINFFMNYWSTYCLGNFENITGDLIFLRAAKMSYFETIIMYVVDIIFYLGLSTIIQSYKDSGLTFCLYLKSFFKHVSRSENIPLVNQDGIINLEKNEKHFQELSLINKQKLEQNQCLKLVNVSKSFDDVQAVKCFNGELFSDEIFCLLGHNGAGKSTTINMISGIFDPDEGDILLDGRSLVTDKKYLYQNIGLCQQEDIFFEHLTVEEHLRYMCEIKGSQVNLQEINDLIYRIDLAQKKDALCGTLSGGQKRKLCIALALIGNSRIILLDEPTSGMDVMARRSLWEFLKNYKAGKIILLTTHFLDEAEYLGDRIGIMTDGEYLCCGTSSYLKSKYPCGFNINLLINSKIFNENYKSQFYQEISKYEPNCEIKVASKAIFSINISSNNKSIKEIFDYIENTKDQYGIEDYTVSSTSLEDVFLKINNKANLHDQKYSSNEPSFNELSGILPTTSNCCTQLAAHISRNLYPFYRNKTLFFFELLSGLGFVYIFIFFFSDMIMNALTTTLDFTDVLDSHKIFIHTEGTDLNFLKNSDTYDRYGTYISLYDIDTKPNNNDHFMQLVYDKALANIAKGSMSIKKEKNGGGDYYKVFNSEVNTGLCGFLYADTMLFVSAFLKESYGIEATFEKITYKAASGSMDQAANILTDMSVLAVVCLINFFGFVVFLGGLMLEKIKEKRTNIKHLLYLSGNNIFSYWLGFYIADYLKLIIFTILLIIPVYTVSGCALFFGLDMLLINISSLSFIYFITFFCSKDDEGAKILFLFVFGFLIIVALLALILKEDILKFINFEDPVITLFDFTPVTSMAYSFVRLIFSYSFIIEFEKMIGHRVDTAGGFKRPEEYLLINYFAQILNIIFYSLLLILAESGLLGKLIHNMHQCCYADPDIKIAPMVPIEDNYKNNNIINNNIINTNYNTIDTNSNYSINSNNAINNIEAPLIEKNNIPNYNNTYTNNQNGNIISNQGYPNQYNSIQNNNQYQTYNNNPAGAPPVVLQNLDFNFNKNISDNPLQNPYVQNEIRKVYSQDELTTRIINITKTFYPCCACCRKGKVRAINHLHLGLEPNEKFGLLGFNGSGKTTTFRAITNEILTDCGTINIFGYDTKKKFKYIRTFVGYCPQINPLFDFMKVKEIIKFYSKLKTCNQSVEEICEKFGLSRYLDTYTINLSGGNKRKLTFAIAMMNKPTLLLLDEPSTGVDPESRRIMWRNINELSNSGHKYNMILTTHSMEEAEILCDTVSWFRAGNFITLGNPEELKLKYSAGYKLHIKFDEGIIKSQIQNGNIEQSLKKACSLIEGFNLYSDYIYQNQFLEPYINSLIQVVQKIKDKTQKISLYLIGRDYSFELVIQIINEMKKELFYEILNMKNTDESVDELSITMQSLENILTSI